MRTRKHLVVFTVLLGVCGVIFWNSNAVKDLPRGELEETYLDKELERDLNTCNAVYMDKNASSRYHQTLKNILHILQEYIPGNYSTKFRNPCWYGSYQIPKGRLIQSSSCTFQASNNVFLYEEAVKQAKSSKKRHLYCLPAFFIPGFPKCATTTLFNMIIKHPLVTHSRCKECKFWLETVTTHGTDLDQKVRTLWYLDMFKSTQTIHSNPSKLTLDATVSYVSSFHGERFCALPVLLRRVLPEAKFILIMRNPSERYFSHYWHITMRAVFQRNTTKLFQYAHSEKGLEDFQKYTLNTIMKFQSCIDKTSAFHCVIREDISTTDIKHSLYYYHIAPWLTIIPQERFLFLRTEDLALDPSLTMSRVWHFLSIHDLTETNVQSRNVNIVTKDLAVPPSTKKVLDEFFRPHNQLLAQLLSDTKYLWNG